MPLKERQAAIRELQKLRPNRRIVSIVNLDRGSEPPQLPGLATQFQEELKEPLFRVLKETLQKRQGLDIFLYTRGGATNAVWPIVGLLREFDANFEVLIPFRAHSSGTMLALGAKKIVMGPLAELSPIDPTTANQFNPRDALNQQAMLGIAVEDVTAYQEFWKQALDFKNEEIKMDQKYALMQPHINRLATEIHPLALGNVHRVYLQINLLARMLLSHHYSGNETATKKIIDALTHEYYSHHHMINRYEAKKILGDDHIDIADKPLSAAMDALLRQYEDDFSMRRSFYLGRYMGDDVEKSARFIGAVVESAEWSYLSSTELKLRQYLAPPPGIQIQIPPGTPAPLVPGLPRQYEWQVMDQAWQRNTVPKGITL
jgi:ClpP class serine protease